VAGATAERRHSRSYAQGEAPQSQHLAADAGGARQVASRMVGSDYRYFQIFSATQWLAQQSNGVIVMCHAPTGAPGDMHRRLLKPLLEKKYPAWASSGTIWYPTNL